MTERWDGLSTCSKPGRSRSHDPAEFVGAFKSASIWMNVLIHISYIRKSVEHLMTKSSPAFSTCPWPQNRKNQNLHACQLCTFTWASLWVQSCTRWFCNIIQILRHKRTEPLLLGTVQQLNSCWKLSHECSIHYSSSLILEHFVPIHQKTSLKVSMAKTPTG